MTTQRKRFILIARCLLLSLVSVLSFVNNHVIAGVIGLTLASHIFRELKDGQIQLPTNEEQANHNSEELAKWKWFIAFNLVVATLIMLLPTVAIFPNSDGTKQWAIITLIMSSYWIFDRARLVLWASCISCLATLASTFYSVITNGSNFRL